MLLKIDGKIGVIPVSLQIELDADTAVGQALQAVSVQVAKAASSSADTESGSELVSLEPAEAPKRKRRKPQRRITKADDGRVEVSAPEMTMLKVLPVDSSPMKLPDLAEAVWPGRKGPSGGPLVGPAARVASGLRAKGLATIEGTGGDKVVSVVEDWKNKAVEVQN